MIIGDVAGGADQAERLPQPGVRESVPTTLQPLPFRVYRRPCTAVPQVGFGHSHHVGGGFVPAFPSGMR